MVLPLGDEVQVLFNVHRLKIGFADDKVLALMARCAMLGPSNALDSSGEMDLLTLLAEDSESASDNVGLASSNDNDDNDDDDVDKASVNASIGDQKENVESLAVANEHRARTHVVDRLAALKLACNNGFGVVCVATAALAHCSYVKR